MIETKEKTHYKVDEHFDKWCTGGPWFNETICQNLQGPLFEGFFVTAHEDIYDFLYVLYVY